MLARAAALNAPLPPVRPAHVAGKPAATETSAATPAKVAAAARVPAPARGVAMLSPGAFGSLTSPYGELVTDGFGLAAAPTSEAMAAELRGATP